VKKLPLSRHRGLQHRLRVSENKVLRRIFGPMRDEITGGWRKLHNGKLHNLYSSPTIIRIIKSRFVRRAGHMEAMEEKRKEYTAGKAAGV
jgi:hypothetical protein